MRKETKLRIGNSPTFPTILDKVTLLTENSTTSPEDYKMYFECDPSLALKLIILANSSFYSHPRKIKTIKDAIAVLGINTLKSLIYASSGSFAEFHKFVGYGFEVEGFNKHSFAVSMLSGIIAQKLELSGQECESLTVAGLLHDIGKLALVQYIKDLADKMWAAIITRKDNIIDIENSFFKINHTKVAELIASQNQMNDDQRAAIIYHHNPDDAGTSRVSASIVHCADFLARKLGFGLKPEFVGFAKMHKSAGEILGLTEDDLLKLAEENFEEIEQRLQILSE